MKIYVRVSELYPNSDAVPGCGLYLTVLHESGQSDATQVNITTDMTAGQINAAVVSGARDFVEANYPVTVDDVVLLSTVA